MHLFSRFKTLTLHNPFNCTLADMEVVDECRSVLCSEITLECKMCQVKGVVDPEMPSGSTQDRMDVNTAFALGVTSCGVGHAALTEFVQL